MRKEVPLFTKKLRLLTFISLAVFIFTTLAFLTGKTTEIDHSIQDEISKINAPSFSGFMKFITFVGHPSVLLMISLILGLMFAIKRKILNAVIFIIAVGGSIILQFTAKQIFERIRPEEGISQSLGFSFPSGHAATAAAFFFLVIWFFNSKIPTRQGRILFKIVNIILAMLVGFSRIFLSVHWASDVIAGFAFGLFWSVSVILLIMFFSNSMSDKAGN